jgi:hypothetical protein
VAEDAGFEPARVLTQHDFQSCCASSARVRSPVFAGLLARPYRVRTDLSLSGGYHGGYHAKISLPTTCAAHARVCRLHKAAPFRVRWPTVSPVRMPGEKDQMYAHAVYTKEMIRALPRYAAFDANEAPDGEVRAACLESFFMHIRAIADFLCCRSKPDARDFSALDFVSDWQATPPDAAERLAGHWETASQHIAHFSRKRLQLVDDPAELTHADTNRADLEAMADDAEAVWNAFVAASGRGISTTPIS